jgi:cytochrome oxidase assembly protein ShyY1
MTTSDDSTTFEMGLWPTVWMLVGLAILLSLGTWQTSRYLAKTERETLLEQRSDKPTLEVSSLETLNPDEHAQRSVRLRGEIDTETNLVIKHRTYNGDPGVWVLQPFELADGGTLLVNRGWFPFEMARENLDELADSPLRAEPTGLLHRLPKVVADDKKRQALEGGQTDLVGRTTEWNTIDVEAMYGNLPGPTPETPLLVVLDETHAGERYPIATTEHVTEPYLTSGRHLSYAIFWYVVAGALVSMYLAAGFGALGSRRRGRPKRAG